MSARGRLRCIRCTATVLALTIALAAPAFFAISPARAESRHGDEPPQQGAEYVEATIQGFRYNPDPLQIPAGTTVTWTQLDTFPHTVTSGDYADPDHGSLFDSPVLDVGDTYS